MKRYLVAIFSCVMVAADCSVAATAQESGSASTKGVAVVELFTSQGCNSCPPADVALRQIEARAKADNASVFVLSFHVDYWNRLGWTDPYSSELASYRQRAYARAAGSTRVYTPQMIVSGTTEFNGSNRVLAAKAINKALRAKATAFVKLDASASEGGVDIDFEVTGADEEFLLNLAIVHTPNANRVPAGENAGRKLAHVNVVRAFKAVRLTESGGSARLSLPEDLNASDARLIAYVQNYNNLSVTGATAIAIQ
ncbi:MAG: DUF1223 domain-containing protein [Planctomycetota bacterium]